MKDNGWLAALYYEFRTPLFLVAWNLLKCQSSAEDAVHAAFVGMASRHNPPDNPKTFAFRCVRNAAIDVLKSRARRREEPIDDVFEEDFSPPNIVDARSQIVADAVNELAPECREVVLLHLQSDLTFREIADIVNEPLQTIASRYRRTIERLRKQLEVYRE